MFYRIVVFHNLNNDSYYFKKLKGYFTSYYVGYVNQYHHQVVMIIPIDEFLNKRGKVRKPLKARFIDKLMFWLEKLK